MRHDCIHVFDFPGTSIHKISLQLPSKTDLISIEKNIKNDDPRYVSFNAGCSLLGICKQIYTMEYTVLQSDNQLGNQKHFYTFLYTYMDYTVYLYELYSINSTVYLYELYSIHSTVYSIQYLL